MAGAISAGQLEVLLKLRDQMTPQLQHTRQALGQASQALGGTTAAANKNTSALASVKGAYVAAAGAAMALAGAYRFVASSLEAAAQQEAAVNRLNLSLKNQGIYSESTSAALQRYATELQRASTFGDEAIMEGEALLASFGMNEQQIIRTTKAAADFAAATGRDLRTSMELLGKAFAGNTGEMSRYGIVIDQSIPKAERFEYALNMMEERFGGQALEATKNYAGQMQQLSNSWGDLKEQAGGIIAQLLDLNTILGGATAALNAANDSGGRMPEWIGVAFRAINPLLAAVQNLSASLKQMDDEARAASGSLANLTNRWQDNAAAAMPGINWDANLREAIQLTEEQVKKDNERAEAARRAAEAEKKALDELVGKLRGEDIAGQLDRLVAAWNRLTPSEKENQQIVERMLDSYKELREQVAPHKLPRDLEAVSNSVARANAELSIANSIAATFGGSLDDLDQELAAIEVAIPALDMTPAEAGERRLKALADAARDGRDDLYGLGSSLDSVGDSIGGPAGGMVSALGSMVQMLVTLEEQAGHNITAMEGLASAAAGLDAGLQESSWWRGAISGALTGASTGGVWGAVIGGIAGAIGGLFGAQREADEAAAALSEQIAQLTEQVEDLAESMGLATTNTTELGNALINSFRGTPGDLEYLIDILEQMQKNLEDIMDATEALSVLTDDWYERLRASGEVTAETQEGFDRLGRYAIAAFQGMIRNGASLLETLQALGPTLSALQRAMQEFGLKASSGLANIIQLYNFVQNNDSVIAAVEALHAVILGLGQAAGATPALFSDFFTEALDLFARLREGGATAQQALLLLQPILQQLWEAARLFGYELTEEQAALLAQAEEAGLVGENFRDVNERILETLQLGLSALIQAVGGELPAAWLAASEAVDKYKGKQTEATDLDIFRGALPTEKPSSSKGKGMAHGGFVSGRVLPFLPRAASGLMVPATPGGTAFVAGEGGSTELIAPVRDLAHEIGAAAAAAAMGAGGQTIVIPVYIGGEKLDEIVLQRTRSGHMQVDSAGVRRRA